MKGGFWLIMLLIGVCSVLREKIFIKKNPNSLEAKSAYSDKLYTQRKKAIEKRYGKNSEQAKDAIKKLIINNMNDYEETNPEKDN